jgi:hypothetical protein
MSFSEKLASFARLLDPSNSGKVLGVDSNGMGVITTGVPGPTGPQGVPGPIGATGATGAQGPAGVDGTSAATTYDAIGSSYLNSTNHALTVNSLYTNTPNSSIIFNDGIPLPAGTWRCMGSNIASSVTTNCCGNPTTTSIYINLFVRVA